MLVVMCLFSHRRVKNSNKVTNKFGVILRFLESVEGNTSVRLGKTRRRVARPSDAR